MKRIFTPLCFAVCALFASADVHAQATPQMLYEIYPGASNFYGCANLYFGTRFGNSYLFSGNDSSTHKLLKTDGTAAGTTVLKNVSQVLNMKEYSGSVYFGFIDTGAAGASLWKTDGTVAGTQVVTTLGGLMHAPHSFNVVNGKLFFCSSNSTQMGFPKQLYVTDGTAANTLMPDPQLYDIGFHFGAINNKLIFSASSSPDTSYLKRELYISDGTSAGTQLLLDIKPGPLGSNPAGFITYNGKVYFGANDGTNGTEVWVSDGTAAGTQMLKNINPGAANAFFNFEAAVYNGKLYFAADDGVQGREVWVSDGTAAGTQVFKDVNPGAGGSNPFSFLSFNGKLLFAADNGTQGNELWSSDGTPANTMLLKDINPGPGSGLGGLYDQNIVCADKLYFDATDATTGSNIEPWTTDGTAAGTTKLAEVHTDPLQGSLDYETRYIYLNGKILFKANGTTSGAELHSVDETCSPLSIGATKHAMACQIYPNPAQEFLVVDGLPVKGAYVVSDLSGRNLYKGLLQAGRDRVSVRGLPSGLYLLHLSAGERVETMKFSVH